MSSFLKEINKAYKSILTEQTPQDIPGIGGAPGAPAPAPAMPAPPIPSGGAPQEQPVETPATRSSSDAFLIGMIAKALLIDIDDDDKLKVVKYLKGLDEDSASAVEENLVNIINSNDYQNIDEELQDFKIPPKKSRKVLKFFKDIMENYIETETGKSKE
jgi:hypothetical protein